MPHVLELTLALLKPDIVRVPFAVQEVRNKILSSGFLVVRSSEIKLSEQKVTAFYQEHAGKFFCHRLKTFMRSGPIWALILAHPNAIEMWRNLMGHSKVCKIQYGNEWSLRGLYGLTDTRNCTHGSDSRTSAEMEIKLIFPEFDIDLWYRKHQ
nr:EOG090X0HUX [Macrothrix elegans]